jgi:type I restriction enzyme, S subunit
VLLGDVCKTTSGGTPSRGNPAYFDGTIPWVKSGELPDGPVADIQESITEAALANSSAKLFPAGTLLIALYGATVGKLGILTRDAATNQAVCAVFPSSVLEQKYLFWFLRFKRRALIESAIGGAQPNISQGILRNLEVPLPTLDAQRVAVAEIEKQFSRLDEAVANLKRVKANLKRYKAAVLKAAVDPLPPRAEQDRIVAEVDRRFSIAREIELEIETSLKRAKRLREATLASSFSKSDLL